jgi:NifU-like protein involved in Fe-S cluster formation
MRTADVFNEVQSTRLAAFEALVEVETAMAKHEAAVTAYEAAQAKAKIFESMEDL